MTLVDIGTINIIRNNTRNHSGNSGIDPFLLREIEEQEERSANSAASSR